MRVCALLLKQVLRIFDDNDKEGKGLTVTEKGIDTLAQPLLSVTDNMPEYKPAVVLPGIFKFIGLEGKDAFVTETKLLAGIEFHVIEYLSGTPATTLNGKYKTCALELKQVTWEEAVKDNVGTLTVNVLLEVLVHPNASVTVRVTVTKPDEV